MAGRMTDKEQFWKSITGVFVQYCGNCVNKSPSKYEICRQDLYDKIYKGDDVCECHGYIGMKPETNLNNPHWEWDGKND